jgi:hypothetical protein
MLGENGRGRQDPFLGPLEKWVIEELQSGICDQLVVSMLKHRALGR